MTIFIDFSKNDSLVHLSISLINKEKEIIGEEDYILSDGEFKSVNEKTNTLFDDGVIKTIFFVLGKNKSYFLKSACEKYLNDKTLTKISWKYKTENSWELVDNI